MPMLSVMTFSSEKKRNAEGDLMKSKKTPERFSIRFDSANPEHQKVIEILSSKGRNAARYIADAVIAYESSKGSLEATVTEVVNKILGLTNIRSGTAENTDMPSDDFDFEDIADDLAGFKK